MVNEIPLKPIKRIIKKYYQGEICQDTCVYVRDFLIEFTEYVAQEAIKEFNDRNKRRKMQKFPLLKRLDKFVFFDITDKIYNQVKNHNIGEVGNSNKILLCQDSDITAINSKNIIIKDAGVEVV